MKCLSLLLARAGHCLTLGAVAAVLPATLVAGVVRAQPVPGQATPPPDDQPLSDVLDDMPDIGVDWPDLQAAPAAGPAVPQPGENTAVPPTSTPATPTPPASGSAIGSPASPASNVTEEQKADLLADDEAEYRYDVKVNGLGAIADSRFRDRFDDGSELMQGKGDRANMAQINRRMKLDRQLLDTLLRAKGFYVARIAPSVTRQENGGNRLLVRYDIVPGPRYTLAEVTLPGLEQAGEHAAGLRSAFPVQPGDPIDADAIVDARTRLVTTLGEQGFPFAAVGEPAVEIDHDTREGDLDVKVDTGGYRRFGTIAVKPSRKTVFSSDHVQRLARFRPDQPYSAKAVEDLRRSIISTGLVSSATIKPVDKGDGEHVDLDVQLAPAPPRTIAGALGFGTGEGYRLDVSWQHRNLLPPEGAVTLRGLAGTKEQSVGIGFRRNNYKARDHVLSAGLTLAHVDQTAYSAQTATLSGSLERQTNIFFQKNWTWSLGGEVLASKERDSFGARAVRTDRTYVITALPVGLTYDGSDDLLNPRRGFRLGGRISPEVAFQRSTFTYMRAQVDASGYVPFGSRVVLAGRARVGSIFGSDVDRIAPSRRFYAGGGASVRGFGYQAIGPVDSNGDPIGGKSLLEFSLEARVTVGNFGIVPFVDAGNISTRFLPQFSDMRMGTGIGLRYYSSFGPIRFDIGTPIQRRPGESRIALYVSLGQAF